MINRRAAPDARSLLRKWAHIIERIGLATAGGSCGLFVAAHIGRANIDLLLGSAIVILMMMLYGAFGFYLGIDLPPPSAHRLYRPLKLLSAAGTFLASTTAFVSVYVIVLDESVRPSSTLFIGLCWAIGASMQNCRRHHRAGAQRQRLRTLTAGRSDDA